MPLPLIVLLMPLLSVSTYLANSRMGRARDDLRPGLRSFPVGQYVIIYTIENEDVEILHVFHGRQDIDGRLGQ